MVRVRNQSLLTTAILIVEGGGPPIQQEITLPERGASRDYFVDVPKPGDVLSAELRVSDDLPANNRAWVVREGSSAKIEGRAAIAPELRRMIDVYQRARPVSQSSAVVGIVDDVARLPANARVIVLSEATDPIATAPLVVSSHPLTDHVGWTRLSGPIRVGGKPPDGWTPLVWSAGRPSLPCGLGCPARCGSGSIFAIGRLRRTSSSSGPMCSSGSAATVRPLSVIRLTNGRRNGTRSKLSLVRKGFGPVSTDDPMEQCGHSIAWTILLSRLQFLIGTSSYRTCPPGTQSWDMSGSLLVGAVGCLVLCAMTWKRSNRSLQIADASAQPVQQAYA